MVCIECTLRRDEVQSDLMDLMCMYVFGGMYHSMIYVSITLCMWLTMNAGSGKAIVLLLHIDEGIEMRIKLGLMCYTLVVKQK